MLEQRRRFASDFLILELAVAAWFWLPYPLSGVLDGIWDRWPLLGLVWFGVWIASPILTLVGLLMVPRALHTRGGWAQVLVGSLVAATIWYQVSRMEF